MTNRESKEYKADLRDSENDRLLDLLEYELYRNGHSDRDDRILLVRDEIILRMARKNRKKVKHDPMLPKRGRGRPRKYPLQVK